MTGKIAAIIVVSVLAVLAAKKLWSGPKDSEAKNVSVDDKYPILTGFLTEMVNLEMILLLVTLFSAIGKQANLIELVIASLIVIAMTFGYCYLLSRLNGKASKMIKIKI